MNNIGRKAKRFIAGLAAAILFFTVFGGNGITKAEGGTVEVTIQLQNEIDAVPVNIAQADIAIAAKAGDNTVTVYTDDEGKATINLEADVEYTLSVDVKGYNVYTETYTPNVGETAKELLLVKSVPAIVSGTVKVGNETTSAKVTFSRDGYDDIVADADGTGEYTASVEQNKKYDVSVKVDDVVFKKSGEIKFDEAAPTLDFDLEKINVQKNDSTTVSIKEDILTEKMLVDKGADNIKVKIKPKAGNFIKDFKVNGNSEVASMDISSGIEYQYTISTINENVNITYTTYSAESGEIDCSISDTNQVKDINNKKIYNKDTTKVNLSVAGAEGVGYTYVEGETSASEYNLADNIDINLNKKISNIYMLKDGVWTKKSINLELIQDNIAPNIKANQKFYTKNDTEDCEIEVTVDEDSSDIDKVTYYKSNEDPSTAVECEKQNEKYILHASDLEEGENIYTVYAKDKAKNESNENVTIIKDTQAPKVDNVIITDGDYRIDNEEYVRATEKLTIKVIASDEVDGVVTSGVEEIVVYDESNNELEKVEGSKTEFIVPETGKNIIQKFTIKCVDRSGNETSISDWSGFDTETNLFKVYPGEMNLDVDIPGENVYKGKGIDDHEVFYIDNTSKKLIMKYSKEVPSFVKVKCGDKEVAVTEKTDDEGTAAFEIDLSKFNVDNNKEIKFDIKSYLTNNQKNPNEQPIYIYVDTEKPKVKVNETQKIKIEEQKVSDDYGTFSNSSIKITVPAEDSASGVKTITMQWLGEAITKTVDKNNSATFKLTLATEKKLQAGEIKFVVTDNVNNSSGDIIITSKNSNVASSEMMIETNKPTIETEELKPIYTDNSKKQWFSSAQKFKTTVSDDKDGSGLYTVNIKCNGEGVKSEDYINKKVYIDTFELSTEDDKDKSNSDLGNYEYSINVIDKAGNEVSKNIKTLYIDPYLPQISAFEFNPAGNEFSKKNVFDVKKTNYGYYFKKKTNVTVRAKDDAPSSGIKSITFYTVSKEGVKSKEETKLVNKDNEAVFIVPENFKGQIYAKPSDNVNHSPKNFVTPASVILETEARHNASKHVTLTKKETKQKDTKKLDLYNKDVTVNAVVEDDFSGISKIEYSVESPYDTKNNQKGTVRIDNNGKKESGSASGWNIVKKDENLVTKMSAPIKVSNNSNNIVVKVKMTDRAGFTSESKMNFSIDKTSPKIEVTYDNNKPDSGNKEYYKKARVATIKVTERNFKAKDFVSKITNKDYKDAVPGIDLTQASSWKVQNNKKDEDAIVHIAKVNFNSDGKFTWDMSYKDLATNSANKISTQKFVVDTKNPEIDVNFDNNTINKAATYEYYDKGRTATITLTEHNFQEERVKITGKYTENGRSYTYPSVSGWTSDGDVHTATIPYSDNGHYTLNVEYMDKAGNKGITYKAIDFAVDKEKPMITINKVKNDGAYKGTVTPYIDFTDNNFDSQKIKYSFYRLEKGEKIEGHITNIKNGQRVSFDNLKKDSKFDGNYVIKAEITDMAGNKMSLSKYFAVNRFGSFYTFDSALGNAASAKYVKNEFDVVIKEQNPNEIKGIKVKLSKNGTATNLELDKDYTVKATVDKNKDKLYEYTIKKELFAGDGSYTIELYSEDKAGNVNENADEKKKASISFGIDKTSPVITPLDLETGAQYDVENKNVEIDVKDNLVLNNVKIYLNDNEVPYQENEGKYSIDVAAMNDTQSVKIVATDLAGNEASVNVTDFLVSTNLFIRWMYNLPLFIGTLVGFGVIIIAVIAYIIFKRKKANVAA